VGRRAPCRDVRCLASRYFSAARQLRAEVRRVRRCVRASAGQCILRGSRQRERVRWVWGRRFHLREPRGLEPVPAVRRGVPANAMFRAA